jgi:SWI/SNF-related matrix-associated actin-dependent regulator 1 of chromatin subfamily A
VRLVPDLFPYQIEGAKFLAAHDRAGLFDEPGVGKTAQAIRALDMVGAKRCLIVCPAAVREVWRGEFKKFATMPRRILKGADTQDLNLWLRGRCDVLLLSYEMATKWAPRLSGDVIDAIVFDESHYIKSPSAARTRAMLGTHCDGKDGLARWASNTWFLTGTPMPNDPTDIWPWLRFTRSTNLGLSPFTARYFRSRMGQFSSHQTPKPEMVPELQQAIGAQSLRRTKTQAGLNLPPIWITTQTVDGDTAEIKALLRQHPDMEKAVLEAIDAGGLSFLDAQHIATLRRLVGEAKAPAAADMVCQELDGGLNKVVIMGLHTKALDRMRDVLRKRGHDIVSIDGRTSENERGLAVKRFQEDPDVRAFIGNIKAAGTGLTLTAASDVIMFESSWAPADNAQAIMRVHRIGQKETVRARFISLANSIDEEVAATVARKTAAITMIQA